MWRGLCVSVCVWRTPVSRAETDETIQMSFGGKTRVRSRNDADGCVWAPPAKYD